MTSIIPAILAHDEDAFLSRLRVAETFATDIQIDAMDGFFTPNESWFDASAVGGMETEAQFELHLMVEEPRKWIDGAKDVASIKRIVWHVEAETDHASLIALCAANGVEAGLAISPETPEETLAPYADKVQEILVLGVRPGFSGQALIPDTIEKARRIHARWPNVPLAFDGGVSATSIPGLRDAGVTRFVAASAIFDAKDPKVAFEELQKV